MAETGRSIVVSMIPPPPLPAVALRLSLGRHFADLPGIVTSSLLLFKCSGVLSTPGIFNMPTSAHATVSLPDDPALLRIEGPIATIALNPPGALHPRALPH